EATPYASAMANVLRSVARRTKKPKNPLLKTHAEIKKVIVIVVASDRGMAGGFNTTVLRAAESFINEMVEKGLDYEIVACGKKTEAYFNFKDLPMGLIIEGRSNHPTIIDAQRISSYVIDEYTAMSADQVVIFYNHALNVADQVLRTEQVLPITQLETDLEADVDWGKAMSDASARVAAAGTGERYSAAQAVARLSEDEADPLNYYEYDPSPAAVLDELLPAYVKTRIYHALMDSAAGEQGARRKAMKSATDSADDMINVLVRNYNRARQSAITTEIAEIVGGAAVLEDN
ncbi:MAG: ATP synthase F1 subunit gamma, partial [Coriobacteriia bacterium]|nr:ATP synthase F1 subunit gamma [Coriobacteriia bacterium]